MCWAHSHFKADVRIGLMVPLQGRVERQKLCTEPHAPAFLASGGRRIAQWDARTGFLMRLIEKVIAEAKKMRGKVFGYPLCS